VRSPVTPQISSFAAAEATRRVVEACIREIQDLPASSMRIISGVELAATGHGATITVDVCVL
jgi:hypothetical protein